MIDKIVIVACGKGTCLQPLKNHIPKILLNIHNDNILCKLINYWNKYCKKFIILINKEYNSYINFYLKQYEEIEYEIRNVEILNNEENSYTIKRGLHDLDNLKILITWCDVFPNEDIEFDKIYENCIFTNSLQCYNSRYLAKNNKIEKMSDSSLGNVIGLFYFINFKQISNKNDTQDLCDCYLDNFDCFETYEIHKIIDISDMEKIRLLLSETVFNTRFFNSIKKIDFETIVKEATCEYGIKIINDEINFYKYIENNNIVYPIEKIFNVTDKSFCMKFIEKNTLYDEIIKKQSNNNIYNVLYFLQNYYNTNIKSVSIDEAKQDIYLETIIKITDRNKKIEDILNEFSYIKYVNSVKIDTYENILKRVENIINIFLNNKTSINYNIIHGDLNLSNIFKMNEKDFLFIDPRGYYGNSKMFGLKYYEISKIYLSMFGFDSFNRDNEYFFSINDNNINTNINMLCDIEIYDDLFSEDEYKLIICLAIAAWLGTPYYFKNNISKTIGSYFYSLYIATLYLDKIENL